MNRSRTWLFILAYVVSTALCACRATAQPMPREQVVQSSTPKTHRCCANKQDRKQESPKHSKQCPHCDGAIAASAVVGQKLSAPPAELGLSVTAACPLRSSHAPFASALIPSSGDSFLPARTLLQLHCALLT